MLAFIGHLWYATMHLSETVPVERGLFFANAELQKNFFWTNCGRRKFGLNVKYHVSRQKLLVEFANPIISPYCSVPPSGPQLKTIKIRWNFLLTIPPQFEGK